jgi:prepilin-type N-terminal cleavage/methylation domain-containing protein
MTGQTHRQRRCGFTLIELLVVIAIVAILLSILFPVLRIAKNQGRRAVCGVHVRQIVTAALTYVEENNGRFNFAANNGLWDNRITNAAQVIDYRPDDPLAYWGIGYAAYTNDRDIFHCPSQKRVDDWPESNLGQAYQKYFYYCAYGLNGYIGVPFPSGSSQTRARAITSIAIPSRIIFCQDHIEQRLDSIDSDMFCIGPGDSVNLRQWRPSAQGGTGFYDSTWAPYDTVGECFRHNGTAILGFLDAHTQTQKETLGEDVPIFWYTGNLKD